MKWNEFLAACKIAWETEGQRETEIHRYLCRCEKNPRMSAIQVASSAYKLYKLENA